MPHISAGWIVSGAADPAVGRNDHGRNFCADGAAAKAVAESDVIAIAIAIVRAIAVAVAVAIARAVAIAVIVAPAVETEAAIVTATVTAKESKDTMAATTPAVESGNAAPMEAAVMKAAARAASCVSGSGE